MNTRIPTPASWSSVRCAIALSLVIPFLISMSAVQSHANPQDLRWWDGFNRPGTDSRVAAIGEFDGDLIVGGRFDVAGGVPANHVACWNGVEWSALGAGTDGEVNGLIVFEGDLIAAGSFSSAGEIPAANIARWDGSTWSPLGAGTNDEIQRLEVYEGDLIALGEFRVAGGIPARYVARWDGVSWHALGTGIGDTGGFPIVSDMTVHGNDLVVGGVFNLAGGVPVTNIARWDGTSWTRIGIWPDLTVSSVISYQNELIATQAYDLYTWDGLNWIPMQSPSFGIRRFHVHDETLVASGNGPGNQSNIVYWDGAAWQALGEEMSSSSDALGSWAGSLLTGGWLIVADGVGVYHVALWDGTRWTPIGEGGGVDAPVLALESYGGDLVAGGGFTYADGLDAWCLARWDGSEWHTVGDGGEFEWGHVTALHSDGAYLYAGGNFTEYSGSSYNTVARWDGATWDDMNGGIPQDGDEAMSVVLDWTGYQGGVVACGAFTLWTIGIYSDNVAFWDGSSWNALGNGLGDHWNTHVITLIVHEDDLVAGGEMNQYGLENLVRWDGTSWHQWPDPPNARVNALAIYNGDLIVGGAFTYVGFTPMDRIVRWDGDTWHPLGEGMNEEVRSLTVFDGYLYAGGEFTTAGGVEAKSIARWDGNAWEPLGSGLDGYYGASADVLLPLDGHLYVGGAFDRAGDKGSYYIARWAGEEASGVDENLIHAQGTTLWLSTFPNPATSSAALSYFIPKQGDVLLTIHDTQGRRVVTLRQHNASAGRNDVVWDVLNDRGLRVAPGIYFARLTANREVCSAKLIVTSK